LNQGPPEYEGVLTTWPWRSIAVCTGGGGGLSPGEGLERVTALSRTRRKLFTTRLRELSCFTLI
jgi:hypothetical protein